MPGSYLSLMHFDDRLATVLRQSAGGERAARTQYRQLLDLLGSRRGGADRSLQDAAWERLARLGEAIPASEQAAMVSETGWRFRNPELAVHLANGEPAVAAAALARADLDEADWTTLIPRLPVRARGFLRLRRDLPRKAVELLERLGVRDRGLPGPEAAVASPAASNDDTPDASDGALLLEEEVNEAEVDPAVPDAPDAGEELAIGALVQRIEAFRKQRSARDPELPLDDHAQKPHAPLRSFSFEADATGRIGWADGDAAAMVVGLHLPMALPPFAGSARNFSVHQPVRGRRVTLQGAPSVSGDWIVNAAPQFDDATGNFTGYCGMFRRPAGDVASACPKEETEADRIRQILHELRTPVNAIQGFSEAIQQQIHGPVPHEYRAHAATIASDAARILASFEEIDRLVKLESRALELDEGNAALVPIVRRTIDQLGPVLNPRMAEFSATLPDLDCLTTIATTEIEGLVWRLLATLAGNIGAGEQLELVLKCGRGECRLTCELPAVLMGYDNVFETSERPTGGALSAGTFGAGFALRLTRAEARAAGGSLTRVDDSLVLTLPALTTPDRVPSQANGRSGPNGG